MSEEAQYNDEITIESLSKEIESVQAFGKFTLDSNACGEDDVSVSVQGKIFSLKREFILSQVSHDWLLAKVLQSENSSKSVMYVHVDPVSFRLLLLILQGSMYLDTFVKDKIKLSAPELTLLISTARILGCMDIASSLDSIKMGLGQVIASQNARILELEGKVFELERTSTSTSQLKSRL